MLPLLCVFTVVVLVDSLLSGSATRVPKNRQKLKSSKAQLINYLPSMCVLFFGFLGQGFGAFSNHKGPKNLQSAGLPHPKGPASGSQSLATRTA